MNTMVQEVAEGVKLLGRITWWSIYGFKCPVAEVQSKLDEAGLDKNYAFTPKAENSFIRAIRYLEEGRIVRHVGERDGKLVYQFTKEYLDEQRLAYDYEAQVSIDKKTGTIECEDEDLKNLISQHFAETSTHFYSHDLTRIIQRIFKKEADILSIRRGGGVYFIPERFSPLIDKVDKFLTSIGVELDVMAVPDAGKSKKTVFRAFWNEMQGDIKSLLGEIEDIEKIERDEITTRSLTLRIKKVKKFMMRVRMYEETLSEKAEDFRSVLGAAKSRLERVLFGPSDGDEETNEDGLTRADVDEANCREVTEE